MAGHAAVIVSTLSQAIEVVMDDHDMHTRHPEGIGAVDMLDEVRDKFPGSFPMCTWLDVYDEMRSLYGPAPR